MAKRKPDPAVEGQLDMFGDWVAPNSLQSDGVTLLALASSIEIFEPPITDNPEETNPIALQLPANDTPSPITVAKTEEILALTLEAAGIEEHTEAKSHGPENGMFPTWLNDEWWTTAMVCDYLKLGRKAIWERQRDHRFQFPPSFHFGTTRHRWRSEDVKAWAKVGH